MQTSLIVAENFLDNFYQIREWALTRDYRTEHYQGGDFPGITSDWGMYPSNKLSELMGHECQPVLSFIRMNDSSNTTPSRIHSDKIVNGAEWASVIYLSDPVQDLTQNCGTGFWKHLETGYMTMPPLDYLQNSGKTFDYYDIIDNDGFDLSKWQFQGFVAQKSNRIIIYPCSVFHSRFPIDMDFGDGKDSRLAWICFFKGV